MVKTYRNGADNDSKGPLAEDITPMRTATAGEDVTKLLQDTAAQGFAIQHCIEKYLTTLNNDIATTKNLTEMVQQTLSSTLQMIVMTISEGMEKVSE